MYTKVSLLRVHVQQMSCNVDAYANIILFIKIIKKFYKFYKLTKKLKFINQKLLGVKLCPGCVVSRLNVLMSSFYFPFFFIFAFFFFLRKAFKKEVSFAFIIKKRRKALSMRCLPSSFRPPQSRVEGACPPECFFFAMHTLVT
jgi:hypothetical protein